MATIQSMQQLLVDLNSEGTIQIPGLDFKTVVKQIVEKDPKCISQYENLKTEEERVKIKDQIIEVYKNYGKAYIDEQINTIKSSYTQVVTGITQVTENISTTIAAALVPPAIAVPAATPNPAFVILDLKVKKNTFSSMIDGLFEIFKKLLQAAINIFFILPDSVLNLLEGLTTVRSLLNTIPA